MKKYYVLLLSSIFLICFTTFAQKQIPSKTTVKNPYLTKKKTHIALKTVTCVDSVRYPQSKLSGVPETGPLTNNTAFQTGLSQAFHFDRTGTIQAIGAYLLLDFDGIPGNFTPVSAKIKIYNIDAQNYPTTPIDSAMVQVVDVGFNEQTLFFTNPITVSDSFAVAIEMGSFNATTDTIWYTTNVCGWNGSICTIGDGNNESLSCVRSEDYTSANGSHWFNNNTELIWNIDFLMHPIMEHDFNSSFTVDTNVVCLGTPLTFTNTTIAHNNPMFHPLSNNYSLDLGDFTTISPFDTNDTHVYNAQGNYTVNLTATQYGYSNNCIESSSKMITILDTAIANFGWTNLGNGAFQFNDSSTSATGINTWAWNFGDGSNSIIQHPNHTYGVPGNYLVCLTVSDSNNCNSNTICDSLSFTVGITNSQSKKEISIHPIPANKYLYVNVSSDYFGGTIVITDLVGKEVKKTAIENKEKIKLNTEKINSGIYFISIEVYGEKIFTKRIAISH